MITGTIEIEAVAVVTHHAPCVPECPVCHPKTGDDQS
jgi:hypothetical protein